jgi:hypothetical protein
MANEPFSTGSMPRTCTLDEEGCRDDAEVEVFVWQRTRQQSKVGMAAGDEDNGAKPLRRGALAVEGVGVGKIWREVVDI